MSLHQHSIAMNALILYMCQMNSVQLMMSTPAGRDLATQIMSTQFIQDGIDESGNEIEAPTEAIQQYDTAIRTGDIPYIDWMTSTYRHYEVPILDTDPYTMLDTANYEALIWLDEQDYTVLPDVVRAIIYDDPILLYTNTTEDMSKNVIRQIILKGTWNIFLQYRRNIIGSIQNICMDTPDDCKILMNILSNTPTGDEQRSDIKRELLKDPVIQQIYNKYTL